METQGTESRRGKTVTTPRLLLFYGVLWLLLITLLRFPSTIPLPVSPPAAVPMRDMPTVQSPTMLTPLLTLPRFLTPVCFVAQIIVLGILIRRRRRAARTGILLTAIGSLTAAVSITLSYPHQVSRALLWSLSVTAVQVFVAIAVFAWLLSLLLGWIRTPDPPKFY